jgi:hypothetical protein
MRGALRTLGLSPLPVTGKITGNLNFGKQNHSRHRKPEKVHNLIPPLLPRRRTLLLTRFEFVVEASIDGSFFSTSHVKSRHYAL